MKIGNLPDGTYFKFIGVNNNLWRGCFVNKVSYSSVSIGGFHRESESEGWKPIPKGYYVSCGTEVEPCSRAEAGGGEETLAAEGIALPKKRGRKSSFRLELPEGEFTLHDLVKKHNRPMSFIYSYFKKISDSCKEVRREKSGRGRGTPVYVSIA